MNEKFLMLMIGLLLIGVISSGTVSAAVSVGVKEGDWIEYCYTYTGSDPEYYPEWARLDFKSIQGTNVTIDLTGEDLEGNNSTTSGTFDLETGAPSLLIIPTNLDVGDEFHHEDYGNITITVTEGYTYADAKRTVVCATVSLTTDYQVEMRWDKTTGILLEADQTMDEYTLKMAVTRTNMWQPQILGLDPTFLYALLISVIVIIAVVAILMFRRKKSPQQNDLTT